MKIEENTVGSRWIFIASGDDDERGCRLCIAFWKWYITIPLPPIIRPHRVKVAAHWDTATIARLGRDWYWNATEREYGVSLCDNHVCFRYGIQTHDSSTEKSWGFFLPWNEYHMMRFSLYGEHGEHVWCQHGVQRGMGAYDEQCKATDALKKIVFNFRDFDGEEIQAATHIEEREWIRGEKWFKWLSWFCKPKVRRSLDIAFSKETGPSKGSWKGGTFGHSIEMLPEELHAAAFRRYCAEHKMTLIV